MAFWKDIQQQFSNNNTNTNLPNHSPVSITVQSATIAFSQDNHIPNKVLLNISINPTDRVISLKNTIEEIEGIPAYKQRLFVLKNHHVRDLEDESVFEDYGLNDGHVVWLQLYQFVKGRNGEDKYMLKHGLGRGTSSRVSAASTLENNATVAIKIIKLRYRFHSVNPDQMYKRTYREIKLLQHFKNHPNIVSPIEVLMNTDAINDTHTMYIVMELMTCDLRRAINDENKKKILLEHVPYIMFQILCAVNALHTANVIHRDLKPENILLKVSQGRYMVKLCDFGTGRDHSENLRKTDNNDVTPLWYRAPEGILNSELYTESVDMWAVGCILVEMHTGVNIFQVTRDGQELLLKMIQYCGMPSQELINKFPDSEYKLCLKEFCDKLSPIDFCPENASKEAMDLMKKLLVFDPDQRLTAYQALNHELFDVIRGECKCDLKNTKTLPKFVLPKQSLTARDWCDLLIQETKTFQ
jgi:serine/threonine protein kinase